MKEFEHKAVVPTAGLRGGIKQVSCAFVCLVVESALFSFSDQSQQQEVALSNSLGVPIQR